MISPIGIRSLYDQCKCFADTFLVDYHRQHKFHIRVVRIFNTYGPRMYPNDGLLVSKLVVQAMRAPAATLEVGNCVKPVFVSFINQSKLPDRYLACDIVVLPSRQAGETWSLVKDEALHAGCAAIVSDKVGREHVFGARDRVRVIPIGNAVALSGGIGKLAVKPHNVGWADRLMADYWTEAAAAIVHAVDALAGPGSASATPVLPNGATR